MLKNFMNIKVVVIVTILLGFTNTIHAQELKQEEVHEWYQVEKKAEFPGGDAAFDKYISSNFRLSNRALKKAKSGTILVAFIVEKNGSISNVRVVSKRKIGFGTEDEAIRVIRGMPKWIPAQQRDKPCRMAFTKPIRLNFN